MSRLEIVDDSGPLKLSASQAAKLGKCEMRWVLGKLSPDEGGSGPRPSYFILGDLVHAGFQAWGSGKNPFDAMLALSGEFGLNYDTDETVRKARSIMLYWVELNGPERHILMGTELPFDIEIPGTKGVRVRGFFDGVRRIPAEDGIRTHDTYRVEEYKTMGRWGRDAYVREAIDTHLYIWAASQQYPNVTGLDFQAISTYDYKPTGDDEADAAKRFRLIEVEYDQRFIDRMLGDLRAVATRGQALLKKPSLAIKNIGDDCRRCEHKTQCLRPWDYDPDWRELS
jgi:hypothetical protein